MNKYLEVENGTLSCLTNRRSKGVFFGDNPFLFGTPVLLAQLSISSLLTAILQYILTPLGETAFISQMLAGFLLGPSVFGKGNKISEFLFPQHSSYVSETSAFFGCMLFIFLLGVKMDVSMVKKTGKKAVVIGLCTFLAPFILNTALAFILKHSITMDTELHQSIVFIATFQSLSSFHVIACLLADLKLLNSELGRLAISSSIISGLCAYSWGFLVFTLKQSSMEKNKSSVLWMFLSFAFLILLIIYVMRPIMLWMVGQIGEGKPVKYRNISVIFIMVLGCGFFSELIGQHFMIGPMILGMAVPDGPPLGSAIVDKLDSFVSGVLLPNYFVFSCSKLSLHSIHLKNFGIVEVLALSSFLGKMVGTMLPSLYCKMPVIDALSLGLIMSAQGITDILMIQNGVLLLLIDEQSYTIMVISAVLITGIITPIVKILYNPSKSYMSCKRRTIQHTKPGGELRMLACIYHQDSTPSILNLLEVSNPTPKSPICFYVVHLTQLLGRLTPLLIAHRPGRRTSSNSNQSDHIIKAFRFFEQYNQGSVMVNLFTAISPYASIHDEICMLALDKRVSLVIVPFHKHWTLHGTEESDNSIRSVNRNILDKAPCSVGILIDRGTTSIAPSCRYSIGIFFVEGTDDREALSYATRMAEHSNVDLTVVRFLDHSTRRKNTMSNELDRDIINQFRMGKMGKKHQFYQEEFVKNSVEMINVIQSLENSFDLILVGRHHASKSQLFEGLEAWNEFPELGLIGDMLASSDSTCQVTVLVVQQHAFAADLNQPCSPKCLDDACLIVNILEEHKQT